MARINQQLSFLDGEILNPDYVVRLGLFCAICGRALSSRVREVYYFAGSKQKRICKVCYKNYAQSFSFEKSLKGGK